MVDAELTVRLPDGDTASLAQDEEWCEVECDGECRRIRFHDYGAVFSVPGLYEHLFDELLDCRSPATVTALLGEQLAEHGCDPSSLSALDLGAGNGMVGEALRDIGIGEVVGVDIVPEAGEAAERDRPGVYHAYHVCDLLDPPPGVRPALRAARFDVLTSVAALGFGDIPPEVFRAAFDLLEHGGWTAFTIKEEFLAAGDRSGFCRLISDMVDDGELELCAQRRYRHRLSVTGEPLHYVAMVGRRRY